jgi:hypothetical protein
MRARRNLRDYEQFQSNPWRNFVDAMKDPAERDVGARYGYQGGLTEPTENLQQLHERAIDDMGLGAYKVPVTYQDYIPNENTSIPYGVVAGDFNRTTGAIRHSRYADPTTVLHEIAHLADESQAGYEPPGGIFSPYTQREQSELHHKYYRDFGSQIPEQIKYQQRIEEGIPVPREAYIQYPWLKGLTPHASNRLATPWRGNDTPDIPPELWNDIKADNRIKDMVSDAETHERKKAGKYWWGR